MLATNIHKDLLLKVMKVADVYEFTIGKTGDRPVDMVSVDGKKYKLTIDELTSSFTTLQGKPIRIIRLTKNKQYLATKLQSTPCYAVKVPKGSNKQIEMPDGHIVGPGKVIVVHANQLVVNGDTVDVSSGTVMTEAFFRKTCVLKEISETLRKLLVNNGVIKDENIKTVDTTEAIPAASSAQPIPQPVTQNTIQPAPTTNVTQQVNDANATLGQIVNVVKAVGTDNIIGYNVLINGQYIPLDVEHTIQACKEGLIGNATAVHNSSSNNYFLRGVGIKLEDLPVSYM